MAVVGGGGLAITPPPYTKPCTRCIVVKITKYDDMDHPKIVVKVAETEEHRLIILRDTWAKTLVEKDDVINIIGDWDGSITGTPAITISSKENLLIHHPDYLITATSLSEGSVCRRKSLISSLVRGTSDTRPASVWGNILHEVMESCLSENRWDEKFINDEIDDVARNKLSDLMKIEVSVEEATKNVRDRAVGLQVFSKRYIGKTPKPDALVNVTRAKNGESSLLAIAQVLDVEEDIWSPTYGLKGKLDASITAVIENQEAPFNNRGQIKKTTSSGPMPLEIKTGSEQNRSIPYRAQTMLYTLLLSERYGYQVNEGLLYYTQSEEPIKVTASRNEIQALVVVRNDMVHHMVKKADNLMKEAELGKFEPTREHLPETIDDDYTCERCYGLDTCMLYRRAVERVDDTSSPIHKLYEKKTGHLTESQCEFFRKWEALISLEEQDLIRFKKELWTMGAEDRESHGRCFSSMIMDQSYKPIKSESNTPGKIQSFSYRFTKRDFYLPVLPKSGLQAADSLLNGHMSVGDAIVVSVEPDLLAIAKGYITELTPEEVTIGIDHKLDPQDIGERARSKSGGKALFDDVVEFRIDKDEMFAGMARIRYNLAHLFYVNGDTRRLELVVDLRPPVFNKQYDELLDSPHHGPVLLEISRPLNSSQNLAIEKVLNAEDYALILGMPGTGKTTVIAALIKALVDLGKTVFLTSYTHSAVDTILLKLKDSADLGILRIGNQEKIHPDAHKYTLSARSTAMTVEQLEHQVMTPPVVATTCLSIDHRAARKAGLDVSLFRLLSENHRDCVVDLTYQYRMNEDIMHLSNTLIYEGKLVCGSEEVAKRCLEIPSYRFIDDLHVKAGDKCDRVSCWLEYLLSPNTKAVFVDTDQVPGHESRVGDLVQNEVEAELVYQLTETLIGCDIKEHQIGIISLYRQQVKLLSHLLVNRKGIEILTADRSQGRDKNCIIISMVRSNDEEQVGDLMKDWRRLNVSFTRARSKLIIIGSRKTLQGNDLLKKFFDIMDEKKWVLTLERDAHRIHSPLSSKKPNRPFKRTVGDRSPTRSPENSPRSPPRPNKKSKAATFSDQSGLLRGRNLLRDLINDSK
ncbi:Dna2-domain-containing protein [Thelephora ganbajun]|uniref:Dna2-domain-containing protein n=1 Tax=Thelephora ganbajun TaxID=370292 RepID=A0ACB6Z433_THEGA|nr:Dna2-domain-containing protein [Thelephora ganbajun]